ncbi:unnamed protein product [Mytilus edulis]|uniref:TIR domain-containing protein n=1 Tax=Mytilus edulis TaxID=6550 RepID=A0A8S3TS61_MYTED|nr:unnamed protein product [Mytilus edulis]
MYALRGMKRLFSSLFVLMIASCAIGLDCPLIICYCKPRNTARCLNHGTNLTYIPRLPKDVKILTFVNNYLPNITRQTFENLSAEFITQLNLSRNHIRTISRDAFVDFKSFYVLDLSSNMGIILDTLDKAFVNVNFIQQGSLYLSNVTTRRGFQTDIFKTLEHGKINKIVLQNNNLLRIDGSSYRNLKYLNTLDVSNNNIVYGNLSGLIKLTRLTISNNNLHTVPSFCASNGSSLVPNLRKLNINNNRIKVLKSNDFHCVKRLDTLNMLNNPFREIQDNAFSSLRKLHRLRLLPIVNSLKRIQSYAFNMSNVNSINLADAHFKFTTNSFNADTIFRFCPRLYALILSYNTIPSNSETAIKMFGSLRHLKQLTLQSVGWVVIPQNLFHRLTSLKKLELESNNLFSLSFNNPFLRVKSLVHLGVGGNKLNTFNKSSLPENIYKNLKTLNLARNPFTCNCNLMWFVHWLNVTNIEIREYPSKYFCVTPGVWKGKQLNTFSQDCSNKRVNITLIVLLCVTGGVILITATIVIFKIRWHIRYWIYLVRARRRDYCRIDVDEYAYDGFVVYCDTDREWVHQKLVPFLEVEHGYKLCIHYRDFHVGKLIVDNILENMEESRKIILVMSNGFCKSKWCQFEVLLANDRCLNNGSETLATVLLEDVNSRYFTNVLKLILTSTTYAVWTDDEIGQRLFWNQILSSFKRDIVYNRDEIQ